MVKSLCILPPYLFLLVASLLIKQTISVQYTVTNGAPTHPGGIRFDQEIGIPYTIRTMETINEFIWDLFEERSNDERRDVPVINVFIADFDSPASYSDFDTSISIGACAIQSFAPGSARFAFASLLVHEMTHIFQELGNWTNPSLIEGIADYVMVKSKYYFPHSYTKPGEGNNWDKGYGVTARFLEYCDGLRQGFTAELNKKMRDEYSDEYFVELLGKPVEKLWAEYKAKYENVPADESNRMKTDSSIMSLTLTDKGDRIKTETSISLASIGESDRITTRVSISLTSTGEGDRITKIIDIIDWEGDTIKTKQSSVEVTTGKVIEKRTTV